jgi:hypothetical protein
MLDLSDIVVQNKISYQSSESRNEKHENIEHPSSLGDAEYGPESSGQFGTRVTRQRVKRVVKSSQTNDVQGCSREVRHNVDFNGPWSGRVCNELTEDVSELGDSLSAR